MYLMTQRTMGASRNGSVFAFAPFIGALLAIGLGDRNLGWGTALGGRIDDGGCADAFGRTVLKKCTCFFLVIAARFFNSFAVLNLIKLFAMSTHCSDSAYSHNATADPRYRRILWLALVLNLLMFVVELSSGLYAGSVSLLADAIDFFVTQPTTACPCWYFRWACCNVPGPHFSRAFAWGFSACLYWAALPGHFSPAHHPTHSPWVWLVSWLCWST